jgi:predicted amidohydrolase
MTTLTIAAAQSISIAADVSANLARHMRFVEAAAAHGVQLLVFPELSLTGYERGHARELAMRLDDARWQPLRAQLASLGMSAVIGAPILGDGDTSERERHHANAGKAGEAGDAEIYVGAPVLHADGSIGLYTKQHLHGGEEQVFHAGRGGADLVIGQARIALAVCADTGHASHAAKAAQRKAQVYAASMLVTPKGYPTDSAELAAYAATHRMAVLMANHGGMTGGWEAAGRSAFWDESGRLVAAAPGPGNLLLIASRQGTQPWSGRLVDVPAQG